MWFALLWLFCPCVAIHPPHIKRRGTTSLDLHPHASAPSFAFYRLVLFLSFLSSHTALRDRRHATHSFIHFASGKPPCDHFGSLCYPTNARTDGSSHPIPQANSHPTRPPPSDSQFHPFTQPTCAHNHPPHSSYKGTSIAPIAAWPI